MVKLLKYGKAAAYLILVMLPCVSYFLFEYITGNLDAINGSMALLNIVWIYMIYLSVFAVSGSTRIAVPLTAVFLYAVSLAEVFVVEFRGRPIMFWDILAVKTAMSVAGNYEFAITWEMYLAFLGVQAISIFALLFPIKVRGVKRRIISFGGLGGVILAFGCCFYSFLMPSMGLGINMWSVGDTYEEYGYVLSTAVSLSYGVKRKPEGYSYARVKEIHDQIKEEERIFLASLEEVEMEQRASVSPVNIICIMNESLSDLKTAGDFETNQEYFPFYNSLKENTIKGSLTVPVFGSMTSNSEFEFLTSDSVALLPAGSIAYQFNVKPDTTSLVSTLKSQGYEAIAMHPYPGDNWNRIECYKNMGFDEFMDLDAYEGSGLLRNYVSDQADYQKLIEIVEAKESPEDKLFLFNVTMQNHGGYESKYDSFPQEVWLTGDLEGTYPKADQYLSLVKRSDEALEYLISYFESSEEPTMVVMFGDHQPSVEDEFFDEISGTPSALVSDEKRLMWYETPFLIWTNYESSAQDKGKMGAIYLAPELLKQAGLEMTPYHKFLLKMEETFPVVHPIGCYDEQERYYTWNSLKKEGNPYRELILNYEYLVYNHIFDGRKYKDMFQLKLEEQP